jgi:2,5-furandicarboxylate decarboxylase 1
VLATTDGPSLAGFLDTANAGVLRIDKSVSLNDIGALTAQAERPIVFNSIEGFPGWRLADQLFVNRAAQAVVLNCDARDVVRRLRDVMRFGPKPLHLVDRGAVQDRIFIGDEVDLSMLPIVRHTAKDPYPYCTSFAVHRDPVSGAFNTMFPRSGVLSKNEMVTSFVTPTANRFLKEYRAQNRPMPQAIVIGAHPAWELAATYTHPHESWWELELFEAIAGFPGELVRCKTVDLHVPADASIIIEGFVHPTRTAQDGPAPGPTMLYTPNISQQPVFEVTAITMRDRPIYRNFLMTPWTDHQEMPRLFHEAIIYDKLEAMGVGVRDVTFPQSGGALSVIVQLDPVMEGQVTDALLSVLGSTWLNTKMVVAVDSDIDIYSDRDVQYALATRVDPSRDVITITNARGSPFDPSARPILDASPTTKDTRFPSLVGKWGIDATKPVPYRAERQNYERAWPEHWGDVNLADYLSHKEDGGHT